MELAYKTLESEFRKRDTLISQFENEVNDLRFALYHEREARVNQVRYLLQSDKSLKLFCLEVIEPGGLMRFFVVVDRKSCTKIS